ncbi:S-layer homology domain-containing protein [Pelotomaculum terephthalicicum JT]|uniref:S-layer homology domain-containing protein n=1 Tax=Pelotomaculum TaxID=191373 RepID=UPI0009D0E1C6|nr:MULTISPECIES: S-layer homology domain-containing protein [Pelotomaculum]MCG9967260.1 S-layer homology domain-containing protein [Pelotomaculum terephthalicicum JT]OPX88635.1 MAG: Endo-1,4-beta-xylanase A precursor [Pelotomaculum sp. PtaB.Bin117]OPY63589.1 MAG: Endo-1,4-beta-xylanase A precursor [Pelotomaculum sp. PtaU1.Bin065]
MKPLRMVKLLACVLTVLAVSLLLSGAGYADDGEVKVNLTSHSSHRVYGPGDRVEMEGTAQNLKEVSITVQDERGELVYSCRPQVEKGVFTAGFTLEPAAAEGKYTIILGGADRPELKRYKFSVSSAGGPEDQTAAGAVLTINGDGVAEEVSFTRAELEAMSREREIFSVVSDWPGNLFVAAEGVPLRTLLEQAGMKPEAQMITFLGSDGYRIDFTVDELLNEPRYYYPNLMESSTDGKEAVQPLIALQRVEDDDDFAKMSDRDTPVLCFGQRALTEQTLCEYVKRLKTITVTTESPAQWEPPAVKIIDPDTRQEAAVPGGKIKKGSEIVLTGDPKVKIYYTTDGGTPDLESKIYNVSFHVPTLNKPIAVENDITVKAKTVGWGKRDSEVVTFTFTVDGLQPGQSAAEQAVEDRPSGQEAAATGNGVAFTDIQESWAREDIEYMSARKLVRGKSETTYEPGSEITRAEFAALLVRALDLPEGVLREGQFQDVAGTEWYAGSVAAAAYEEIITGYDGGFFKPDACVTREEMAAMITRAARAAGKEETLSGGGREQQLAQFRDRQMISPWAEEDVALAVRAGIIKGLPGGDFSPLTNADRAQSAAVLKRFLTYINPAAAQ